VYQNAVEKGVKIVQKPVRLNSPELGRVSVMTLLAPNGFLIEIFQKS
jgi:hypothetical protein